MKSGIIGLPNVGKSLLFNCLSNTKAQSANFPFCTIEPNIGMVNVPDSRLNVLQELTGTNKVIPATVEITDIAGLVKGASSGEGLGNKFLSNIRETNAIIHVLRCFKNDNVTHVEGNVDPVRDKELVETELKIKDLETIEKRVEKVKRAASTGNKEALLEMTLLEKLQSTLGEDKAISSMDYSEQESLLMKGYDLLSQKPVLYVCNVDDSGLPDGNDYVKAVRDSIIGTDSELLIVSVATESEIADLDIEEEKQLFLQELGLKESGLSRMIRSIYKLLNYQTYFTAGEKEVRAWTITKGMNAPQAAGIIHSDFEKGFIRAEVIKYEDYCKFGSEGKVKEAGKLSVEGKEYIVQDGDIMNFRFNV